MKTRKLEQKEEVVQENTLSFSEAIVLNSAMSSMKNKGLSIESIKTVVRIKVKLKAESEAVQAMQTAVMDKYDVPQQDGGYEFKNHPNIKEIVKELQELQATKVIVEGLNSIPEEEIIQATPDIPTDTLVLLIEKLGKK